MNQRMACEVEGRQEVVDLCEEESGPLCAVALRTTVWEEDAWVSYIVGWRTPTTAPFGAAAGERIERQ